MNDSDLTEEYRTRKLHGLPPFRRRVETVRDAYEYVAACSKTGTCDDTEGIAHALWILETWVNGIRESVFGKEDQ